MKLLGEINNKDIHLYSNLDGIILSIEKYSVLSNVYYGIDEIRNIKNTYSNLEIFVNINKNLFDFELDEVKNILIQLDEIGICGVFFYDLAILELKRSLDLNIELIWSQTHMVTNYKTCDYYNEMGVKYALLSKEITLDEMIEINNKSNIIPMVEVVSLPSVAYSKRKLISNYYKNINENSINKLMVLEKVSNQEYELIEDDNGCGFLLKDIINGTSIIKELYKDNFSYIIMREYGINNFLELMNDTKKYIDNKCSDDTYISKWKCLGDNMGFFFKKTVYQVKKNG